MEQALRRATDELEKRIEKLIKANQELQKEIKNLKQENHQLLDLNQVLESNHEAIAIGKTLPVGIFHANAQGELIYVNQRWCEQTGLSQMTALKNGWEQALHPEDRQKVIAQWQHCIQAKLPYKSEYRLQRPDGTSIWVVAQAEPTREDNGTSNSYVGFIFDITEYKEIDEQLVRNAFYDPLTELPNRALFMDRLRCAFRRAKNEKYLFAVLFLDLDRFKLVNDSLGHLVGDQLLMAIATRLQRCIRPIDTVARLAGDEFAILLEDIKSTDEATQVAEQIHLSLTSSFNLDQHEVFTSSSIGIAIGGAQENAQAKIYDQPENLLRDADIAMYRAKSQGRSRHEVFNPEMHIHTITRLQLETDLRRALERESLKVYYQPIVYLDTGRLAGFEALVRWPHAERGFISPGEFIPVAEETGLILPLGRWVLKQACLQMRQWQDQFPAVQELTMSVNLSGKQLSTPDLINQIDQILAETGLEPSTLKLEITESVLVDNPDVAAGVLEEIRSRHIQLCLDDFGTGYSSLSYLHRFPINTLKIDRSFVSRMGGEDENSELVRSIVMLANNLGMYVVAEGVETQEQLVQLWALECEYGQGYFFSKPLDSEAAGALIATAPQW